MCCSKGHFRRRDRSRTSWRAESGPLGGTVGDREWMRAEGRRERSRHCMWWQAPGFAGPRGEESGGRPRFKRFERGSAAI